jgi:hypothetical protein
LIELNNSFIVVSISCLSWYFIFSPDLSAILNHLRLQLGVFFFAGASGALVSSTGYYWPFLVVGPIFICIGSGLLSTISEKLSYGKLVVYQLVSALALCILTFGLQFGYDRSFRLVLAAFCRIPLVRCYLTQFLWSPMRVLVAVQADVDDERDVPQAVALLTFTR